MLKQILFLSKILMVTNILLECLINLMINKHQKKSKYAIGNDLCIKKFIYTYLILNKYYIFRSLFFQEFQ